MKTFNITYIQYNILWEQKEANFLQLEKFLENVTKTDLILLPEMFATGFSMNANSLFEIEKGKTLSWMQKMAASHESIICGSVITKVNDAFYNRLYWVYPSGEFKVYDKHHLFSLAHEEDTYTAGETHLIIEYKGWRIKPLICYDLRFPVWCRNTEDVDIMLFVANWPERRSEAWKALLKARAIENLCYVAAVNRVGEDGNGVDHSGDSVVHDCLGNIISHAEPHEVAVKSVVLSKEHITETRNKFGFLNDRDHFTIH